jgi:hypothetical protein
MCYFYAVLLLLDLCRVDEPNLGEERAEADGEAERQDRDLALTQNVEESPGQDTLVEAEYENAEQAQTAADY